MISWLFLGVVAMNCAAALVLLRALIYRRPIYRPMLLNIGLSVAPVLVLAVTLAGLTVAALLQSPVVLWVVMIIGGLVWLVLLPNAGYLITELNMSHRRADDPVPLWYDIVAVLSLTLSGVLNTVLNVLLVQFLVIALVDPNTTRPFELGWVWVTGGVILLLVSFGIYLGRYLRFNSWDLMHPRSFVGKLVEHFREPGRLASTALFCVLHTIFFAIVYLVTVAPIATRPLG